MNSKTKRNKKQQLINLYGSTCCWCCKKFEEKEITIEHLLHKCHGGSNAIENLLLACNDCNKSRNNRIVPEKYSLESIGYKTIISRLRNKF